MSVGLLTLAVVTMLIAVESQLIFDPAYDVLLQGFAKSYDQQ